jgi:hypothetical protein
MFNSNILDVAIGMIFIYLLLSVMCSAANEMIELMLKKRAIDLERGIRELLKPGSASGKADIVQQLYDHALINNLFGGSYAESKIKTRFPWLRLRRTQLPSYIPARSFALALMDLAALPQAADFKADPEAAVEPPTDQPVSGAACAMVASRVPASAAPFVVTQPADPGAPPTNTVPAAGETAPPPPPGSAGNALTPLRTAIADNKLLPAVTRRSLITLLDAAGNDVAKARENIENWYNSSMDRVSGWYKRRAQVTIFIIGVFVAIAVNVDTITIAKRLSTDKALRESLVSAADAYAKANAETTATPTPTPTPAPDENVPNESTTAPATSTPTPQAGEAPTPRPTATPRATATPRPTATPAPLPAACVTDPNSKECEAAKKQQVAEELEKACQDPNSAQCLVAKTCTEPDTAACQQARGLEIACKDPAAPKCKYLSTQLQIQSLGLPIGWDDKTDPKRNFTGWHLGPGGWWEQFKWHWLGWLLTALAISLGAPFWFDLLNKFIVIRSAVKPHEKSPEEKSKD